MIITPVHAKQAQHDIRETRLAAVIEYLRSVVLQSPAGGERFHAIFVDSHRAYLGDEALGRGEGRALTLRMRDLFGHALALGATGVIIAHNHPSGDCRPSQYDIDATKRLAMVASALDIELLDHLIFTQSSVYSMRAGGIL